MFEFTKGNEMEDLKSLFNRGLTDSVVMNFKSKVLKIRKFNNREYYNEWVLTSDGWYSCNSIKWEETAKLVKEDKPKMSVISLTENGGYIPEGDKMEKIIVRGLKELRKYRAGKTSDFLTYNGLVILASCDVEKIVKAFNSVGGNFEYKPIEVIDTLEKWERFQEVICRKDCLYYNRVSRDFFESHAVIENIEVFSIKCIEERYRVDLQILKGDE